MSGARDVQFTGLTPYLYYEDANAAVEWLCRVFGFEEVVRYVDDADGQAIQAELLAGSYPILITGMRKGYWEQQGRGPVGQLLIVHLEGVDAHHAHAAAEGATATVPKDELYGVREYEATDLEGHRWLFWEKISDRLVLREGEVEVRRRSGVGVLPESTGGDADR